MCPPSSHSNGHVASGEQVRKVVADICKLPLQRSPAVRNAARRARKRASLRKRSMVGQEIESVPKPVDTDSVLIILDWDDTILPTSFLASRQLGLESAVPGDVASAFETYAKEVCSTIGCLKAFGRVMIVTNAEAGWVELTCAKFLPDLVPAIADLQRVSARSTYEPLGFQGPMQWKTEAFVEQMQSHFGDNDPSVLSIGDANHERVAAFHAAARLKADVKSIKLLEKPDLATLQREHALLQEHFPHLQSIPSLDVRLDDI
jgi:hypothetical protein